MKFKYRIRALLRTWLGIEENTTDIQYENEKINNALNQIQINSDKIDRLLNQ